MATSASPITAAALAMAAVTDDHRRQAHKELGWVLTPFDKAMTLQPQRRIIETRAARIAQAQARAATQTPPSP